MSGTNRCAPDAWIVGASRPLPTDPTEFDWPGRTPMVGCSHLVCLVCKQRVKARDGFYLSNEDTTNHHLVAERSRQLYAGNDWTAVDGVTVDASFRLYACSCFYRSESQALITFDPTNEDFAGNPRRNLPWTCAGHPALELPFELQGQSISDASQLTAAVTRAAKDAAQNDVVRGLYYRTQNGSLDDIFADALKAAAAGSGPLDEALKTLFVTQTSLAPLNSFVEELIRYQTNIATPDRVRREQIVDILSAVVAQRPGGVPETGTLELLRDEALQGVVTSEQLGMFALHDRDWLIAHLDDLLSESSEHAGGILVQVGRAMLERSVDQEAALRTITAAAGKTGIAVDTLVAQAQADLGLGMYLGSTKRVVEALKRR